MIAVDAYFAMVASNPRRAIKDAARMRHTGEDQGFRCRLRHDAEPQRVILSNEQAGMTLDEVCKHLPREDSRQ